MIKYQTISEFMHSPFGRGVDLTKDQKYRKMYETEGSKIKIASYCILEPSYYIHLQIPSDSKKDERYTYDVVLRFFTDKPELEKAPDLTQYYLQFFSNSPGFIYQYAVLYKNHGYLIEELFDKLDPEFKDKLPEKTNKEMKLSYDKSIYFAMLYLSKYKFKVLSKKGFSLMQHKTSMAGMLSKISDFQGIKFDQALIQQERKLERQLEEAKRQKKKQNTRNESKKQPGTTSSNSAHPGIRRIRPTSKKSKVTARRTTKRR